MATALDHSLLCDTFICLLTSKDPSLILLKVSHHNTTLLNSRSSLLCIRNLKVVRESLDSNPLLTVDELGGPPSLS